MKFIQLNKSCYYFDAPVNIGYVHKQNQGMLIDAGIDDSVMRKVLKQLREKELPITHLFITHAHADHYGGAHFLKKRRDVYKIAPSFEEAILRNPALEPLYLFSGNDPLQELHNKFLEGKPVAIDHILQEGENEIDNFVFEAHSLPGHSYHQLALKIDNVLYAGDSYFGEDQLKKHKIPYITDANKTIQSLNKLLEINCDGAVPGHGTYEKEFKQTVKANITYHEKLLDWLLEKIGSEKKGISHETIISAMCEQYAIGKTTLSQWLLYRTAVTAYLVGLIQQEKITYTIKGYKWVFEKA
ncbi:MBL fold metallo-hydrolase [Virgibacillus alimentarius]|uniref:MBL fold metallo-hydrolase n=1 Tax=Virgibacillus alimentarius TaxID=698769 RepID=UPI000493322E|nr:MBL fold metallo-hydrolase [Virgibacillus alimentarius]